MTFSRNFLVSFISLVAFLVLATISAHLYGGEPGTKADLKDIPVWQKIRPAGESIWSVVSVPSGEQSASSEEASGSGPNEDGWWSALRARLQAEWERSGSHSSEEISDISQKIMESFYRWREEWLSKN